MAGIYTYADQCKCKSARQCNRPVAGNKKRPHSVNREGAWLGALCLARRLARLRMGKARRVKAWLPTFQFSLARVRRTLTEQYEP